MRGRIGAIIAGLAAAVGASQAAQAAVVYEGVVGGAEFTYTAPDFITAFTKVLAPDLDACLTYFSGPCDFVSFDPGQAAVIQVHAGQANFFATFDAGVFSQTGTHYAFRSSLKVTEVSAAVPEPSTWALTILGLGGVGATLRRRRTVAA